MIESTVNATTFNGTHPAKFRTSLQAYILSNNCRQEYVLNMGGCGSKGNAADKQALAHSRQIEQMNKVDQANEDKKVKLLLLGAGESGKSTIFKQMKILHGVNGYTKPELLRMKDTVYSNIVQNMNMVTRFAFSDESEELKSLDVEQLKSLWRDPMVQRAWEDRAEYQVQDSLAYYMKDVDRIGSANYIPNEQDVLRARVRTSGIIETSYMVDKTPFVMFDVGGQRNERKKWIHCFDNVTAVIFVAAINEYNQMLYEDPTMNRLDEAVALFDDICNNLYFKNTSMILFLNKIDLFVEKLAKIPFRVDRGEHARHKDFQGSFDASRYAPGSKEYAKAFDKYQTETKDYIRKMFWKKNKQKKNEYTHFTCATNTKNVDMVIMTCKDIILKEKMDVFL